MVFVKFHNMNRKKKFLMSPLNSNSKNVSLYNKSKQYYNHSSKNVQFSFLLFFNLCSDVLSILLKMSVLSFFFFFHMLYSTMFKFLLFLFFSFRLFSLVLYVFVFVFIFSFSFFHFFS